MLTIDGSLGEGGGQILRTALALSLCLQRPFRIHRIRAARPRPGLQPQHLAAVRAATALSRAKLAGAEPGSGALTFTPGPVSPGEYRFDIGTAGSTSLVLQTVLPALMLASGPSVVILEGGTHNPFAPPFDFLDQVFLPLINRMGPVITSRLVRPGFAPAGGGRIEVAIRPVPTLMPLELTERGAIVAQYAEVLLANLPEHIARRELAVIAQELGYAGSQLRTRIEDAAPGPGNVVSITVKSTRITELFSACGRRGVPAERVAEQVVGEVRRYLAAAVPAGRHLADQLLLPIALAGGGTFVTQEPGSHTRTNMEIIRAFLKLRFETEEIRPDVWRIHLPARNPVRLG